jgi:hypothetical protein
MKSCTQLNTKPHALPSCRHLLLPLFLLLGAVGVKAQYTFDNATTSSGIAGNLGTLTAGGSRSTPVLVDLNGDGKLDIVTGNAGGMFRYFVNNGTAKSIPATPGAMNWSLAPSNPFAGFSTVSQGGSSAPAFVDIDNDGDLDMFSGNGWGRIHYYENVGSNSFVERFDADNPFYYEDLPNVGVYVPVVVPAGSSTIGFLDGDGDGDMDAVLGNAQGQFYYAENYGTQFSAVYVRVPLAGDVIGTPGEIDGPRTAVSQRAPQVLQLTTSNTNRSASVCIVDMNCDGISDVLSGTRAGTFQFRQLDQVTLPGRFTSITGTAAPLDGKDVGTSGNNNDYSYPAAGDLDGDGDMDFVSGNATGSFRYFRNTTCNTAPTFTPNVCGQSFSVALNANGDTERALVAGDFGTPMATSGCSNPASMVFTPDIVTCANVGTPVTVTLQARDNVTGVKSSPTGCTVTVTVTDASAPTAVCKPFYDVEVGDGNKTLGTVPVSAVENGSTDNCTSNLALTKTVSYSYTTTQPLDCSNIGITGFEIYLTVEDASNNSDATPFTGVSICTTQVRVVDTKGPIVDVTTLSSLTREQCNYNAPSDAFLPGFEIPVPSATDRCDGQADAVFVKVNGGAEATVTAGVPDWGTAYPLDFTVGTYILTWIYEDGQSPVNRTTQTQTLTITAPKLQFASCPTQDVVLDPVSPPTTCVGRTAPQGTIPGSEVDWTGLNQTTNVTLCSSTPPSPVTISRTHTASSVFPYGTTTVYYSAQDGAGNVGNCSFKVIVRDPIAQLTVILGSLTQTTIAPFNSLPINSSYPGGSAFSFADDGGTNCGRTITWTAAPSVTNPQHPCAGPYTLSTRVYSSTSALLTVGAPISSGSFFPVGTTTIVWVAADSKGNTYEVGYFDINIQDIAPTITCPVLSITQDALAGQCQAPVTVPAAIASDNCPGVTVASSGAPFSSANGGTGTFQSLYGLGYVNLPTPVTFTAVDANSFQTQCTVNVYVRDKQKPMFASCPVSKTITVDNTPGCGEYYNSVGGNWLDPFVSDNGGSCSLDLDSVSIIITHPDFAPVVLEDGKDNSNSSGTPFDNLSLDRTLDHLFNEGTSTVLYTATDLAGNTGTCQFTVTVRDNVAPNVYCPLQPVLRSTVSNCRDTLPLYPMVYDDGLNAIDVAPVSGVCGTPVVTYRSVGSSVNLPVSTTYPVGVHTLVAVVTDRSGNTSSCQFQIDVRDMNPPTHTNCPADITINDTDGGCGQVVTWTGPIFTDDCTAQNALTIVRSHSSGAVFSVGTTPVSIVARDAANNQSAACAFSVIVNDKSKPVFTACPSNVTLNITNSDPAFCDKEYSWQVATNEDCLFDNLYFHDATTIIYSQIYVINTLTSNTIDATFTETFPVGATTLVYRAQDVEGNTQFCSFTITVQDKQGPEINNCPSADIVVVTSGCTGVPVGWTAPTVAFDNCGTGSMGAPNFAPGTTFAPGSRVVRYVATDNLGNTSECTFNVIVKEGTAPTFTPLASYFNQPPCSGYAVYIPASDCAGNGTLSSLSQLTAPAATDNCAPTTVIPTLMSNSGAPFSTALTFPQSITSGGLTVVWKATDASGNTATCEQTIYAEDRVKPVVNCAGIDFTVAVDAPGNTFIPITSQRWVDSLSNNLPITTDNCTTGFFPGYLFGGNPTVQSPPLQYPLGTTTIIWEASDNSGNTGTCSQRITVVSGTTPTCSVSLNSCPPAASGTAGTPINLGALPTATTSGTCSGTTSVSRTLNGNPISQNHTFPAPGTYTVVYVASNGSASSAACNQTVTVSASGCAPNQLPTASCPSNSPITVSADAGQCFATTSTIALGNALVGDNCTTQGNVSANGGTLGTITVSNNAAAQLAAGQTHTITIMATNSFGPATACMKSVTVNYNAEICGNGIDDDCDGDTDEGCSNGGCVETELPLPSTAAQYGYSVDIENDLAIVGSPDEGSGKAYVYRHDGSSWVLLHTLNPATGTAKFGMSVATDGSRVAVGAPKQATTVGAVWVYDIPATGAPVQVGSVINGQGAGEFGCAVDVDGNTLIVGDPYYDPVVGSTTYNAGGAAYILTYTGSAWPAPAAANRYTSSTGNIRTNGRFGTSVTLDGNIAAVGAINETVSGLTYAGAAYIYEKTGSTWPVTGLRITQNSAVSASYFGQSIDVAGNTLIVGAFNARQGLTTGNRTGAAYLHTRASATSWPLAAKLIALDGMSTNRFGYAVALDGTTAIVGAYYNDDQDIDAGQAYLFDIQSSITAGGSVIESGNIIDPSGAPNDWLGFSVGISNGTWIVGAPRRDNGGTDRGQVLILDGVGCNIVSNISVDDRRRPDEVEESISESTVRCFPNPSSDRVNIDVTVDVEGALDITLVDATGRTVSDVFHGTAQIGVSQYTLEAGSLTNGMYFIRIASEGLNKVVPVAIVR